MPNMIFVNLPVADLAAAKAFYSALGFGLNEQFSDERTASFVVSDAIVVMVMTQDRFREFTERPGVADPRTAREVINAFGVDSRDEVDRLIEAGLAAGGHPVRQDRGPRLHVRPRHRRPGRPPPRVRVDGPVGRRRGVSPGQTARSGRTLRTSPSIASA
ncbi:VOC family protein [Pseudonocardia sp. HH130629-09]|uniref:VOC family protein n=1 Tax=Pseudonocardia sp. HH130629-09 TaxID=1641402 RepID=UPI001930FA27|nr:hypothetical protein [Pseudonocardia sp. HH130629-09]